MTKHLAISPEAAADRLAIASAGFTRDDAVDALFAGLLGDKSQAEFIAHHGCQKAADRVRLPASCLHHGGNGRALFAVEHRKHLSLL